MGEKHIKTAGFILTNYSGNQCYDQYVDLNWLIDQIHKMKYPLSKDKFLKLLNDARKG